MRIVVLVIIIIIAAVLVWSLRLSRKKDSAIGDVVDDLMIAGISTVFADGAILLFNNELTSMLSYSAYFFCTDLLMFYLLRFVFVSTREKIPTFLCNKIFIPMIIVDALVLFSNPIHQLAFTVYQTEIFDGLEFYRFEGGPLCLYHGILAGWIVVVCVIVLIKKILTSSGIDCVKYNIILGIIVICVVLNAFSLYFKWGIDVSILIYVFAGMLFHYFTLKVIPNQLRQSTVGLVVDNMQFALVVFDNNYLCNYANGIASDLFDIKEGERLKEDTDVLKLLGVDKNISIEELRKNKQDEENGKELTKVLPGKDGKQLRIKIQYKVLYNKYKFRIGSYIFARDITKEYEESLREQYNATHDSLTGLYNKEYFYKRCEETLRDNPDVEYFMVSSDVLNFKLVNDLFGYAKGDELLCRIADKMREICGDYNVYGRIGNDKFALMIPKSKYKRENFVSAPKSVAYIDADIYYPLAIYVGVYDIIDRTMPISVMYDRATMAMNSIKGDYRQRVANYTDELRKKAMIDQNMISKFDVALQNGDIKMFLQPQVNDKGEVVGAEALARWVDPEKGIIPPIDFIPLIEKNGMIGKLDVYMWRLACSRLAMWKKMGVDMNISVNISPKDFYYMDLNKIFRNYIKIYDITPNKLHLEITETAVITNVAKQVLLINNLKELGYVVEMDDFGSGYSSLNMLKDIPVDVVKIDMAFLQKSDNVSKAKKILSAIIALCKELDMKTVVEGVEDSNQLAFLLDEGADLFQGYFYSKPIPVEEFEEKYIPDYEEKKKLLKDYEEVEVVI